MLSLVYMPEGGTPLFRCYGTGNVLILSPSSTPGLPRPPRGSPTPLAPAAAARTAEYENPPTNPYVPPNPFVGADAYIGPRSLHRFYGNLRRMRNCPTSPYSYTFPYCSNNVPCKKSLLLYSILTKAKINNILYFNNMGGELGKGHYGGNYV